MNTSLATSSNCVLSLCQEGDVSGDGYPGSVQPGLHHRPPHPGPVHHRPARHRREVQLRDPAEGIRDPESEADMVGN